MGSCTGNPITFTITVNPQNGDDLYNLSKLAGEALCLASGRPGTRVVSHDFGMGEDWPAELTMKVGGDTIYLWRIE